MAHDPLSWHAWDGTHHHGVDPKQYIEVFGETLSDYLDTYGEIGFPWATSPLEEHEGYIWLYTERQPGEQIFNNGGQLPVNEINPVQAALICVHTTGDLHHLRKRFHSHYGFFLIEARDESSMGVVATGGWADYGIMHTKYKVTHCPLPSDPPGFTNLMQPPYRATTPEFRGGVMMQFWSGLGPNPAFAEYFPDNPNHLMRLAWSTLDATEYPDKNHCADEEYDKTAYLVGNRQFQIFTAALNNLPAAPFYGWTNRHGHLVTPTGNPGVDEVPLVVTAGTPAGLSMINRMVRQGDPNVAPIMVF